MKLARPLLALAAVASLLTIAIATAAPLRKRILGRPDGSAPATAPVAIAAEREFTPRVLATGSIRLLPGARIEVGARVSGVVQSLTVTQGSRVQRGDVIARLDTLEANARVSQAEAKVADLEATARQVQEDLVRAETLAQSDGVTRQELLASRTMLATTRARLDGARADLSLARIQLNYTVIRAPISGVVASVTTHEGETVAASLAAPTFVTLMDPTRLECVALVDETDIGHVTIGDAVDFTIDAYPGRVFRGAVVRIAPDATVIGGVVDYEVTVRVKDGTDDLKPQMTASVGIAGRTRTALVIPIAAVRQSPQGTYAWRRRGGAPERVAIRLGARQADVAEVRAGLVRGDTVLTGSFPGGQ